MLLSYTSIIITQNNLIHRFHKMVTTYLQHITNNVDTRDPIGSKNSVVSLTAVILTSQYWSSLCCTMPVQLAYLQYSTVHYSTVHYSTAGVPLHHLPHRGVVVVVDVHPGLGAQPSVPHPVEPAAAGVM